MLIISGIQQLASWFNKDLSDDIAVTTAETGYINDWISLQWTKHFEKYSARKQEGAYRLLLLDGHGSHHSGEFFKFCEYHKINPVGTPPHTTYLLQPLYQVSPCPKIFARHGQNLLRGPLSCRTEDGVVRTRHGDHLQELMLHHPVQGIENSITLHG